MVLPLYSKLFTPITLSPIQAALAQLTQLSTDHQAKLVHYYNERTDIPNGLGEHHWAFGTLIREKEQDSFQVTSVELFMATCGRVEHAKSRLGLLYREQFREDQLAVPRRRGHIILSDPVIVDGIMNFLRGADRPVPIMLSLHYYHYWHQDKVPVQQVFSVRELWLDDQSENEAGEQPLKDPAAFKRAMVPENLGGIDLRRYEDRSLGQLLLVAGPRVEPVVAAALGFQYCTGSLIEGERPAPPSHPVSLVELVERLKPQLIT